MVTASVQNIDHENACFRFIRDAIYKQTGITINDSKDGLLKARLHRRLDALGMNGYQEYTSFLRTQPKEHPEWQLFINALTTNKTDWFRENAHFDTLIHSILPKWLKLKRNTLKVWCAASSTGEEAYTLAMVLAQHLPAGKTFSIVASDIDTQVLAHAQNGVYNKKALSQIPGQYHRYFDLGSADISQWMRVKPELKQRISFKKVNLIDRNFPWKGEFDLIFCRNVFIYFTSEDIAKVVTAMHLTAASDSLLFVGHSESLGRIGVPFDLSSQRSIAKEVLLKVSNAHPVNVGEIAFSAKGTVLTTTLASSVSIGICDPESRLGGLAHCSLPGLSPGDDTDYRFCVTAINKLIEEMKARTTTLLGRWLVKVAAATPGDEQGETVAGSALIHLQSLGINPASSATDDTSRRRIFFFPDTGKLLCELTKEPEPNEAIQQQQEETNHREKLSIFIIDDSKSMRSLIRKILERDGRFQISGEAPDPLAALELLPGLQCDAITLDIHMPRMNGVTFLREHLRSIPKPVVLLSSLSLSDGDNVLQGLEAGAVDYVQKPALAEMEAFAKCFCDKLVAASQVPQSKILALVGRKTTKVQSGRTAKKDIIVAIGASTGGTEAIKDVLIALPDRIPPIVIVQHIPPVFSQAFANRMNSLCAFQVKEAEHGEVLEENKVLVAPGGKQMAVVKDHGGLRAMITDDPPVNRHKPSVDYLFDSITSLGLQTIGVILTGMGADGAEGLLRLKQSGAITIAQDAKSCVVFGMPKAAIAIDAVDHVCALENVPEKLVALWSGSLKKTG